MAEPNKQYTGDGSDNYIDAARKAAEAAKQFGTASTQKAAAAGAEAAANAAAASVKAGVEAGTAVSEIAAGTAAGGPVGTVVSAAWSLRHTLFKVLVVTCLCLLFIIVMIVSLPSIVFNSIFHTDPDTVDPSGFTDITAIYNEMADTVTGCVATAYNDAKAEVERIVRDGGYDYTLSMNSVIDNGYVSVDYDVCYILAAYSASLNQKGTTKEDLKKKLDAAASQMFKVTYEVKETSVLVQPVSSGEEPERKTVQYAVCTIHTFNTSVILSAFKIDPDAPYGQFKQRTGDVIESMAMALKRTLYGSIVRNQSPPITDAELSAFLDSLTCGPARKELIRAALSLVGRVPYFWGGKSPPGWNDDWNTPRLVTATGDSTTGTLQPFGLDCSGFVDWVYNTALGVSLPGGSAGQWNSSKAISESELKPGDLGFMAVPSPVSTNHVLIYAGKDSSGNNLWVHCNGDTGDVALNSPGYVRHYRRVNGAGLDDMAVTGADGG